MLRYQFTDQDSHKFHKTSIESILILLFKDGLVVLNRLLIKESKKDNLEITPVLESLKMATKIVNCPLGDSYHHIRAKILNLNLQKIISREQIIICLTYVNLIIRKPDACSNQSS